MDNTVDTPAQQPPAKKLSVDEFATKIKAKYPAYAKIDNNTLTEKMLAKYPEYNERVDVPKKAGGAGSPQPDSHGYTPTPEDIKNKADWDKFYSDLDHRGFYAGSGQSGSGSKPSQDTLPQGMRKPNLTAVVKGENPFDKTQQLATGTPITQYNRKLHLPSRLLTDEEKKQFDGPIAMQRFGDLKNTEHAHQAHSWENIGEFVPQTVLGGLQKDLADATYFLGSQFGAVSGYSDDKTTENRVQEFANRLNKQAESHLDEAEQNQLPNTIAGKSVAGFTGFVPTMVEMLTPGIGEEAGLSKLGKFFFGKFPVLLGAKGLFSHYDDAKRAGKTDYEATEEGLKGLASGYGEGLLYEGAGKVAGKLFKAATKIGEKAFENVGWLKDNKLATGAGRAMLHSAAQGLAFSTVPVIENALQGKGTSLDEIVDNGMFGAAMGAFSTPGADGKGKPTAADGGTIAILEREPLIHLSNFMQFDTDQLGYINDLKANSTDLQMISASYAQKAFDSTDLDEKQQNVALSSLYGKMASGKAVLEAMNKDKDGLLDTIKQTGIDNDVLTRLEVKINTAYKQFNPIEQQMTAIGKDMDAIQGEIDNNQAIIDDKNSDTVSKAKAEHANEILTKNLNEKKSKLDELIKQQEDAQKQQKGPQGRQADNEPQNTLGGDEATNQVADSGTTEKEGVLNEAGGGEPNPALTTQQEGGENATQKINEQEGGEPEHQGVPQGGNLPTHSAEVREEESGQTGDSSSNEPKEEKPQEKVVAEAGMPFIKEFWENDVVPVLKNILGGGKNALKGIVHALDPTIGVSTKAMDDIASPLNSRREAETAIDKSLSAFEKMFDKMKEPDRIAFIDRLKRGQKQPTQELQNIADFYRQLDKSLYDAIKKYKGNFKFKEDHFRVLWKTIPGESAKTKSWFGGSRRPLEGSKGFFRQATLSDMSEGIARGGVPVSTNPITMYKLAYSDAMKFITASQMFDALKKDGFVKFSSNGEVPEGYTKINDKIAKVYFPIETKTGGTVMANAGQWVAEENAARIINNHLSKDWIRESEIGKGLMAIKNLQTQIELSLSAFHAVAIGLEGMSSDLGIGFRKLINLGDIGGLKDIITSPGAFKKTFSLGRQYIKYATQKDFENSEFGKEFLARNPQAEQYLHDLFAGGGLVKQNAEWKANTVQAFKDAINKNNYIGAGIRGLFALPEMITKPLFDTYIPAMKVGLFMKEFPLALKEQESRIAKGLTTRDEIARKTINFIDDRMGEMNFDNLFWNRTFKTANQFMFRSVTWKLGNVRAMGGAFPEQAIEMKNAYNEGRMPQLSPKMAWVFGLIAMQATLATITQHMLAGKPLETFKDFIAPRTDEKDDKQRMQFPTYFKDIATLKYKGAMPYLESSFSSPASRLYDVWQNKDFQNYQIFDPNDDIPQKVKDQVKYLFNPEPLSLSNILKEREKGAPLHKQILPLFGINPAPKYITNEPIENRITDMFNLYRPTRSKTNKEADDVKNQIKDYYMKKDTTKVQELMKDAVDRGLLNVPEIIGSLRHALRKDDPQVFMFTGTENGKPTGRPLIPMDIKVDLFNEMTDEEKKKYDPLGIVAVYAKKKADYEKKKEESEKSFSIKKK